MTSSGAARGYLPPHGIECFILAYLCGELPLVEPLDATTVIALRDSSEGVEVYV